LRLRQVLRLRLDIVDFDLQQFLSPALVSGHLEDVTDLDRWINL
jgi:hypothetical protein